MHYVSIVGPPAAGKSSLARELAAFFGCGLFRLRQWVPASALIDRATSDHKLWLETGIVLRALSQFLDTLGASCDPTHGKPVFIADNFPGTGEQVSQLHRLVIGRLGAVEAIYLVLRTDDKLLARRANRRRVCQTCEADQIGDARLPVEPAGQNSDRCAHCNGHLTARRTDAPLVLAQRLARYYRNESGIRSAALSIGARLLDVDATLPKADLASISRVYIQWGSS